MFVPIYPIMYHTADVCKICVIQWWGAGVSGRGLHSLLRVATPGICVYTQACIHNRTTCFERSKNKVNKTIVTACGKSYCIHIYMYICVCMALYVDVSSTTTNYYSTYYMYSLFLWQQLLFNCNQTNNNV